MLRSEYYCYLLNQIIGLISKSVNHYLERKMNYLLTKKPLTKRGFHTSPEGIEPPLQEPESCVISFTLRRQYLIILPQKVVFGKVFPLNFWHKKSPGKGAPRPDWLSLFLVRTEENRVDIAEGDSIITVFWHLNRGIAFMFSTREETIIFKHELFWNAWKAVWLN